MTYEEALNFNQKWTAEQARNDLERYLLRNEPCAYKAIALAMQALEKQMHENNFINECNCVVDYEMLYKAIDNKCKTMNCYVRDKYRIVLRNSYPSVCINRVWHYVHILIGELKYGRIRKGYVIHHADKNKLNASEKNLELMSNLKHSQYHGNERKGMDYRSEAGKRKGIAAAKEVRTRKDVSVGVVKALKEKGLSVSEIAKQLNCGENTVYRRIAAYEA